jgi:dienelactone hydrolase
VPRTPYVRWAGSALATTVLAAGLVTATGPGSASAAAPDPLVAGPATVTRVLYDQGPTLVGGSTSQTVVPQQIEGDLFLPAGGGPFPVVLFMHGRHSTCDLTVTEFLGDPCPETPVTRPIQSFTGYDEMAALLASHGYLVASVDANGVNSYDLTAGDAGAHARSQVLAKTLDLVASWSAGGTPSPAGVDLRGKADLSRIGLMGHSRGGEGVTDFLAYNKVRPAAADPANGPDFGPRYPGLKAVFALAPIDRKAQVPVGAAHASLVPYCDGDVSDLSGTRPYERAVRANSAAGFPSVQYGVQGANHNDFNTVWTNDDNGGSRDIACGRNQPGGTRLRQPDAYKLGSTLITAFLRRYVGPEPALDDLVTGRTPLPASACASGPSVPCDEQVQTSYAAPAAARQVLHEPSRQHVRDADRHRHRRAGHRRGLHPADRLHAQQQRRGLSCCRRQHADLHQPQHDPPADSRSGTDRRP